MTVAFLHARMACQHPNDTPPVSATIFCRTASYINQKQPEKCKIIHRHIEMLMDYFVVISVELTYHLL